MSKLKQNISYHLFYQILSMLLPLITTPYIVRVIGVEGTGIYSYTYAIVQYFLLFIMLGINNYGNRTIAKHKNDKAELSYYFWNLYIMQVIMFLVTLIIYIFYIYTFVEQYHFIMQIEILFLISACFDINWFFFGLEKFKLTVVRNTIIKIVSIIGIFLLVKNSNDLILYVILMASANFISNIVLWPYIFKNLSFSKIDWKLVNKNFKKNFVLFIPVLAISIYNIMDKIMIGSIIGANEVSYYENAEKIINIPLNLLTAVGTVMLPRISNLINKNNQKKILSYIDSTMKLLLCIACPAVFGLIAIADDLVIIYLGSNFIPSINMIKLLSVIIIFKCWANIIRTEYLIPNEMDHSYIVSVILGAIFNLIFNLLLIPIFGGIGAVIGTIIAEFVVAITQTYFVRKKLEITKYLKYLFKNVISSLIMFFAIYSLNFLNLNHLSNLILKFTYGVLVYSILNIPYIKSITNLKKS